VQNFDYNQYQAWRALKAATATEQDQDEHKELASAAPATATTTVSGDTLSGESQSSVATPTAGKFGLTISTMKRGGKGRYKTRWI